MFESSISRRITLHTQHLDHVVVETKRRPPAEQSLRVRPTESTQTYTCRKEMYTRSLHSQAAADKDSESNQKRPKSNYRQNRLELSSRQSPRLPTHFPRKASAMNGDDACQRASSSVGQRSLSYQIHLGSSSPSPSKKTPRSSARRSGTRGRRDLSRAYESTIKRDHDLSVCRRGSSWRALWRWAVHSLEWNSTHTQTSQVRHIPRKCPLEVLSRRQQSDGNSSKWWYKYSLNPVIHESRHVSSEVLPRAQATVVTIDEQCIDTFPRHHLT